MVILNEPVDTVLSHWQNLTGKQMIKAPNLAVQPMTINAPQPIPKSEAIRLIEATLLLNGVALVPTEDNSVKVLNVMAGQTPQGQGLVMHASAATLPKGDQVVSYFMPLRYLSPQDAASLFTQQFANPLQGTFARYIPAPSAQALIITEKASIIRAAIALQELVDVPPSKVTSEFVVLERADAERVAKLVTDLLEKRKGSNSTPGSLPQAVQNVAQPGQPPAPVQIVVASEDRAFAAGDVQLVPDPRTNRILVVTRPINLDYIKDLIKQFDIATKFSDPLEVPLRYVTAAEVLNVLKSLFADEKEDAVGGSGSRPGQVATPSQSPSSSTGNSLSKPDRISVPAEDTAPEAVVVGKTRLIADKKANSILVSGPPESIEKVRTILQKLDKKPRQVYIAAVIGQLTLGDNLEWGIDLLHKFSEAGRIDSGTIGVASGLRTRTGAADTIVNPRTLTGAGAFPLPSGLTLYGAFGTALDVFVKMLQSDNRFKVLSRPVVYTSNNKKASISSGQSVPFPANTLSSLNTGTTNNASVSASVEFKDVVLKLEVLPLINSNKEITLQIAQANDTIIGTQVIGGNSVPIIGKQDLTTTITVPDGATVVMGGLVTESHQKDESGVPFLSKIPVLGYFFKHVTKIDQRQELLILIQPHVVENEIDEITASELESLKTTIGIEGPEPTVPPIKNGKTPKGPPPDSITR